MAPILVLAGLGLLAFPAFTYRLGRQLPPHVWARLCGKALVSGAGAVQIGALLYATPVVLKAGGLDVAANTCERLFGPLVPGGEALGWSATVVAVALPALFLFGALRSRLTQRSARIEADLGEHRRHGRHDLVVLPCEDPLALGVDGDPGQIVVSRGLLRTLSDGELDAVVRHEAAHLSHGHHRFLVMSGAIEQAFGFLPPVRRSLRALRTGLERWADESSTGTDLQRRSALRAALVKTTWAMGAGPVPAFSEVDTVMERLAALDQPPLPLSGPSRNRLYASGLALAVVAVAALVGWLCEAGVLNAVGLCPFM
jgi:hypothetical protein